MKTAFCDGDRLTLEHYRTVAEGVARLIGNHCEVVLHSLEDAEHSVVKIINGTVSGRSIGAPLTNLCFDILRDAEKNHTDIIGPYYSRSKTGKTTRSVTCVIRGASGSPIGLICFNMDLSCSIENIIHEYARKPGRTDAGFSEIYPHTVEELIHHMLGEAISAANDMKGVSTQERNIAAVQMLIERGVFNFKGAVDIVAQELCISRTSVYNYMRGERGAQEN